jgi:hypothetical protein
MKLTITILFKIGLILLFSAQVWAGGKQVVVTAGGSDFNIAPGGFHLRSGRFHNHLAPGQFYLYHPLHFPYVYYYQSFGSSIIIVIPDFNLHQVPVSKVVNAPFFCLLHHVGYVSRIGMLDHLAGAHKFALETAGIICPQGATHCLFPSSY